MAKLKVFRTPIGFHDAYIAATSRKAALAAWGAEKDLFARGVAEEVTDPALTAAPLAAPGEVIKVSRGGREEQLAALPKAVSARAKPTSPRKTAAKPRPKPSREALDAAEQALAEAESRHEAERAELAKEQAALDRRRREIERRHDTEVAGLEREQERVEAAYRKALATWRAD